MTEIDSEGEFKSELLRINNQQSPARSTSKPKISVLSLSDKIQLGHKDDVDVQTESLGLNNRGRISRSNSHLLVPETRDGINSAAVLKT